MQIAIPLFPRFTPLDAIGPYEVLHRLPDAEVVFVGEAPGAVFDASGAAALMANQAYDDVVDPDVIVVPGGIGTRRLARDGGPLIDWIAHVDQRTSVTASVCTGALLLAAAGLLDGRKATTHWSARELLGQLGAVPVDQRVVEQQGMHGPVWTAAGVSAGVDLALQLAARLADPLTAQAIQLQIEYDPEPPFDSGALGKVGEDVVARAVELAQR